MKKFYCLRIHLSKRLTKLLHLIFTNYLTRFIVLKLQKIQKINLIVSLELIQNLNLDAISLDNPYLKMDKKIFSCVGNNFKFSKGDVISVELMGNSIITKVLDDFIEYAQDDKKIHCIRQNSSNIYLIKDNNLKDSN